MNKQEKIKEGIARVGFERGLGTLAKFYDGIENIPAELLQTCLDDEMGWAAYQVDNLHSQGAVIQVESELPEYVGAVSMLDRLTKMIAEEVQQAMLNARFVAVIPIKEG